MIGFSWRVLPVKERTLKGIYYLPHPLFPIMIVVLLTLCFLTGGLSGAQIVTPSMSPSAFAFFVALTALVAIDADFVSGNDQVPVGYVIFVLCRSQPSADPLMKGRRGTPITDSPVFVDLPGGTAVPHWTYLNVTTTDTWDPITAQAAGGRSSPFFLEVSLHDNHAFTDGPESVAVKPPVSTLSTGTSSGHTSSGTSTLPSIGASNNSSGGGGSHAGAIAGGVVGGLAGLGVLAAVVVWFIVRKKRAQQTAPSSSSNSGYPPPNTYPRYEHPPVSPGPASPQMVYNPSDPSTFPTVVQDPSLGNGSSAYPQTLYDPHATRRGQYSGAPEV